MKDQAALLREMMATARARPEPAPVTGPPTIVVGSGKGGVGKSLVSALLAAALARGGRRVLLVDGDQNLGNLHVLLGVRPTIRLEALLQGDIAPAELLQPVIENLWLLPSDSGAESLYGLGATDRARLHHRLSALYDEFDAVVVDAGAGLESVVRVSTMRATRLLVVTAPEPTALTDAYALIKIVSVQVPDLPIDVLVNRTMTDDEGRSSFEKLATASERFLRRGLRYLGAVPEEATMRQAARDPRQLLQPDGGSPAAQTLTTIAAERLDLPPAVRLVG